MSAVLKDELLEIRPMRDADLAMVLDIEREAYAFPWSEGIFRDCLRAGYCCWVVEHQGLVRAYGIMQVGVGESHILNLCVYPDLRRLGYGRRLINALLFKAQDALVKQVFLEVRPSNRAAMALYLSAGFEEIGVRPAYYQAKEGRENAVVLSLSLTSSD